MLEKAYSRRTAPKPLDRSVRLVDVRPHLLATRKFSGPPPTERRVELERQRIVAALEANGLRPVTRGADSNTLVYGYHDVRVLPSSRVSGPFLRSSPLLTLCSVRSPRMMNHDEA